MKRCLILVLLFTAGFGVACALSGCQGFSANGNSAAKIYVARVDGEIDARTAEYLGRVISEAASSNASAVVIKLDTPGGELDSTQEIVEDISNAKKVPIITYVSPQGARAASAGTFILMGSDVAAMAPQTRTGAATPITATGQDIPGDLGNKIRNDATAFIASLADAHGRNQKWAEKAVKEGAAIDAEKALQIGVIEYDKPDVRSVLDAANGEKVEPKGITLHTANAAIVREPPNFKERYGVSLYFVAVPVIVIVLAVAVAALAARRTNRWPVSTGREGMIGEVGTVRRRISSASGGMVFVHGELWHAVPEDSSVPLEPGEEVEVVGFRRTSIVVRPAGNL